MEDLRAQPDEAAVTIWRSWPLNPRVQSDDEASIDLEMGTTAFRLLHLPVEIISNIFESFVPAPLPTGTGLPLSTDILASRRALVNLRLTSKFCNEIALPLMYRNVIITNRMQMANLLVSLVSQQGRCEWMRSLAVLADLTFEEVSMQDDREILIRSRRALETNEVPNQGELLTKAITRVKYHIYQLYDVIQSASWPITPTVRYEWRIRWFYYRLLRIILYLGIRIEDILLTAPPSAQSRNLWDYRKVAHGDLDAMTSGQLPPPSSVDAAFGDIFKSLRRVRTQSDPRRMVRFEPIPVTLEFLKCQKWEFSRDNGTWLSLIPYGHGASLTPIYQPSKYLEIFSHVTELRLYNSRTHPAWLRRCLRYAKNLKIFCYTTRATEWNREFAQSALTSRERSATLQQALEEVMETLTDLHLGWTPSGAELTGEDQAAVAPHRVDVSRFPRLKTVDIDPAFIFREEEEEEEEEKGHGDDDGAYLWF